MQQAQHAVACVANGFFSRSECRAARLGRNHYAAAAAARLGSLATATAATAATTAAAAAAAAGCTATASTNASINQRNSTATATRGQRCHQRYQRHLGGAWVKRRQSSSISATAAARKESLGFHYPTPSQ